MPTLAGADTAHASALPSDPASWREALAAEGEPGGPPGGPALRSSVASSANAASPLRALRWDAQARAEAVGSNGHIPGGEAAGRRPTDASRQPASQPPPPPLAPAVLSSGWAGQARGPMPRLPPVSVPLLPGERLAGPGHAVEQRSGADAEGAHLARAAAAEAEAARLRHEGDAMAAQCLEAEDEAARVAHLAREEGAAAGAAGTSARRAAEAAVGLARTVGSLRSHLVAGARRGAAMSLARTLRAAAQRRVARCFSRLRESALLGRAAEEVKRAGEAAEAVAAGMARREQELRRWGLLSDAPEGGGHAASSSDGQLPAEAGRQSPRRHAAQALVAALRAAEARAEAAESASRQERRLREAAEDALATGVATRRSQAVDAEVTARVERRLAAIAAEHQAALQAREAALAGLATEREDQVLRLARAAAAVACSGATTRRKDAAQMLVAELEREMQSRKAAEQRLAEAVSVLRVAQGLVPSAARHGRRHSGSDTKSWHGAPDASSDEDGSSSGSEDSAEGTTASVGRSLDTTHLPECGQHVSGPAQWAGPAAGQPWPARGAVPQPAHQQPPVVSRGDPFAPELVPIGRAASRP